MKTVKRIFCVITILFAVLVTGTGCSDKPENKAAKELRESTDKIMQEARDGLYLEVSDRSESEAVPDKLENAIRELDSAINKNRDAGDAVDSAVMAKGDLIFAKSQKDHALLVDYVLPVTEIASELFSQSNRLAALKLQQGSLQSLIDVNNDRISKLNLLLDGSDDNKGLKKELSIKKSELAELTDKIAGLESEKDKLQKEASDLQGRAEAMFRRAEAVSGEQSATLSTEGLELRSKSNERQIAVQEKINELQLLQSNVEIVEPMVEKLKEDILSVREQIATINDSEEKANLQGQLSSVKQEISKAGNEINATLRLIDGAKDEYIKRADSILELLAGAIEDFEKVRLSSLRNIASEKIAVCYYWKGTVGSEKAGLAKYYVSILESLSEAFGDSVSTNISGLISSAKLEQDEYKDAAFEDYDNADVKYESVSGNEEYTCSVQKRHVLALYGKLILAEGLGEYDVSDAAAEKIDPLVEKVKECDPDFSRSLTAKLLEGKSDFMPILAIDNTELYESIRMQYQSNQWSSFPVEQREAAVMQLLEDLDALEHEETFDREAYDSILGPEKQKLLKAMESGFEEDAYSNPNDPNNF